MRASYRWLLELSGVEATAEEVAARLTDAGLEVEGLEPFGRQLEHVVIAEIRERRKHPDRDKLSIVKVFDGQAEIEVICGAPNVPDPGGHVLFARVGANLPGDFAIGEREIAGVVSRGMICSETELRIGEGSDGIVRVDELGLETPVTPGVAAVEALCLDDVAIDIGLTPNRPDALGHVGLARELAILSGCVFSPPVVAAPRQLAAQPGGFRAGDVLTLPFAADGASVSSRPEIDLSRLSIDVQISDAVRCPRYGAGLVRGVSVGPSPWWVRYRLFVLGLRAIHNVVDATNLAMLEWGHPVHAFDLARVRGARIDVRAAEQGEIMSTLDSVERSFVPDDLLICDGEGPVAVAGVMGGENSEIRGDTTDVLVECAYFLPSAVRRTSRRLGLHTDASHRFERGVDPDAVPTVLARTVQLVADLGGGVAVPTGLDVHPAPIEPKVVPYRPSRANALLGFGTPVAEARRLLEALGCEVRGDDEVMVRAPTFRPDLVREVDLIEEVGRLQGYDRVPTVVPHVRASAVGDPPEVTFVRRLREALVGIGLYEAVTYAFVSEGELRAARSPTNWVRLANPLSEERSVLRTSLLPGLAAATGHAQRRQVASVRLFEVARTYHAEAGAVLPDERLTLAVLLSGPRDRWIGEGEAVDFYDGKGVLERVFDALFQRRIELKFGDALDQTAPELHPKRRAELWFEGEQVGALGELHPEVAEELQLEGRPVFAKIDVDKLVGLSQRLPVLQAAEPPRFPAVSRDLALLVDDDVVAEEVSQALADAGAGLVEAVELFDLYRGTQLPEGKKSLAFRLRYRSSEDTLTDKKVDKVHTKVQKAAVSRFGAQVR